MPFASSGLESHASERKTMSHEGVVREVELNAGRATLQGALAVPKAAGALVIFAHGSGSSRFRNRHVAHLLNNAGFATLLLNLLTKREEALDMVTSHLRFDVSFLADRLLAATAWAMQQDETRLLKIGYCGASTGAAASLAAAAELPRSILAVVSRGGRPDLAKSALSRVTAPTLLIVGSNDTKVIELNKSAMTEMRCIKQIELVPNAGHLFEEPGALDMVAQLASDWFTAHLSWETPGQTSTAS